MIKMIRRIKNNKLERRRKGGILNRWIKMKILKIRTKINSLH